jgi:membrane associated rhomboid family serine protease
VVLVVFFFVVELPAVVFLAGWFLLQLLEANQALRLGVDGGVAWWAHAGGFVAGMFLMTLLGPRPAPPASELESPSVGRPPAA